MAGVAKWAHRIFEAADWLAYRKIALATLEEKGRESEAENVKLTAQRDRLEQEVDAMKEENVKLTAQRDRLEQELDATKQVLPQTVLWRLRVRR